MSTLYCLATATRNLRFQSLVRVVLNEHADTADLRIRQWLFQSLVRVVLNEHLLAASGYFERDVVSIPRSGCAE